MSAKTFVLKDLCKKVRVDERTARRKLRIAHAERRAPRSISKTRYVFLVRNKNEVASIIK